MKAQTLSAQQVAEQLGIATTTVYRALDVGALAGYARLDDAGRPRFKVSAVDRLRQLAQQ
jgi:DNA-binding IclR family transcriptional regulator